MQTSSDTRDKYALQLAEPPQVYFESDSVRLKRINYYAHEVQTPHHHDFATVTLVFRGESQERSEFDDHTAAACTVLVKPPYIDHENLYGEHGSVSMQLAFAPRAFPQFPLGDACWHLDGGAAAAAMIAVVRAALETDKKRLAMLIAHAINVTAAQFRRPTPPPDWLAEIPRVIESAPAEPVSVCALARRVDMHPVSLARAFRRHHACSISEFVKRTRVVAASRCIAAGNASLADVAAETGFADQPHLTRAFRAELGCTPGEFRKLVV